MKKAVKIREATAGDAEAVAHIRKVCWVDTYVNDEVGISRQLMEKKVENFDSKEEIDILRKKLTKNKSSNAWVTLSKCNGNVGSLYS